MTETSPQQDEATAASMPAEVRFLGDHIEVVHPEGFEITPGATREIWELIGRECQMHECDRVLIDAPRPSRSMKTLDAFESGVKAAESSRRLRVALFFKDYRPDDLSEFFKTVAKNRGVTVEFFIDRDEALRWLLA